MLQGISLKEKVRERKKDREKKEKTRDDQASSGSEAQLLHFSKGTFIPCLTHRGSFALIETRIFLHTFSTNDVVYIIFWPWRPVNIL